MDSRRCGTSSGLLVNRNWSPWTFTAHCMPIEGSSRDSFERYVSHSSGGWAEIGMLHSVPLPVVGGPDLWTSVKRAGWNDIGCSLHEVAGPRAVRAIPRAMLHFRCRHPGLHG